MSVHYGVIADDFTGATDIASFMANQGWRVVQTNGVPSQHDRCPDDVDVIVIALKSRALPINEAVTQSLAAAQWLKTCAQAEHFYFKYCSTFDSNSQGNIGPVSDALMHYLGANMLVHCPALPQNNRTVVHGHLFVAGVLLNQSGMENHPINPMRDARISRLLAPQTKGTIAELHFPVIKNGVAAIHEKLAEFQMQAINHVIVDTLDEDTLLTLAKALNDQVLLAGGSGLGGALAQYSAIHHEGRRAVLTLHREKGCIILAGSCSLMTQQQVQSYKSQAAHISLDISRCVEHDKTYIDELVTWACSHQQDKLAPLIYATQPADVLREIQQQYGEQVASAAVENTFSELARQLSVQGFKTFIVAGGETSGTVVQSLQVNQLHIGPTIVPGVPWVEDRQQGFTLALKSGNFGDTQFFRTAQERLK